MMTTRVCALALTLLTLFYLNFVWSDDVVPVDEDAVHVDESKRLNTFRSLKNLEKMRQRVSNLTKLLCGVEEKLERLDDSAEAEARERDLLKLMRQLASELSGDIKTAQKRTCKVNLGGHCSTENAVAMADQWNFLNSYFSPGRRRRRQGGAGSASDEPIRDVQTHDVIS